MSSKQSSSTYQRVVRTEDQEIVCGEDKIESAYTLAMVLLQRGYLAAEVAELTGLSLEEVLTLCGS